MQFQVLSKYRKKRLYQLNPNDESNLYIGIAKTTKGNLLLEGVYEEIISVSEEQFQHEFIEYYKWQPCDLSDAEVGDSIEDHDCNIYKITYIDDEIPRTIVADSGFICFSNSGFKSNISCDSRDNAKRLIKKSKFKRTELYQAVIQDKASRLYYQSNLYFESLIAARLHYDYGTIVIALVPNTKIVVDVENV